MTKRLTFDGHRRADAAALCAEPPGPRPTKDAKAAAEPVVKQLEAFRRDDFDTAFTFASEEIRAQFDRPGFETMVRRGYPEIARSTFAAVTKTELRSDGLAYVTVKIRGSQRPGHRGAVRAGVAERVEDQRGGHAARRRRDLMPPPPRGEGEVGAHGLRLHAGAAGLPPGGARLARRERAGRSQGPRLRLLARRRRGGQPPARVAAHAPQGGLRGHGLAGRVRRPRRLDHGVDHPLRGDVARGQPAAAEPQRPQHAGPHADEARHPGPARPASRPHPDRGGHLVPGLLRARTRAATWPISRPARCWTATTTC